jgi:hypothetical protein
MATPRFCDACGAALLAGARFCEACGAAVAPDAAPAQAAPPERAPAAAGPPRRPASPASDHLPERAGPASDPFPAQPTRRVASGVLLALGLLVLAGAVGVWYALQPAQTPPPSAPPQTTPGARRAPPPAERPPARPAVTRSDIDALKSAVAAANRAHVAAIFASKDPPPDLRIRLNQAIGALGQALYRHHVEDGNGDLAAARTEMRSFLEGLDHDGLGLSAPVIDEGVASVAP